MRKLALLIGATFGGLNVVSSDITMMNKYLESNIGGAWDKSEINPIIDASFSDVKQILSESKKSELDFLFVYWSGHGGYDPKNEEIFIDVTNENRLRESAFHQLAERQLVIFDTCNAIPEDAGLESFTESFKFGITASESDRERARAREYYEQRIMASGGLQKAYSCSIREYSNADEILGSIYTREIIKKAKSWHSSSLSKDFATIYEIAKLASPKCSEYNQNPRMSGPKSFDSRQFYPFAIRA